MPLQHSPIIEADFKAPEQSSQYLTPGQLLDGVVASRKLAKEDFQPIVPMEDPPPIYVPSSKPIGKNGQPLNHPSQTQQDFKPNKHNPEGLQPAMGLPSDTLKGPLSTPPHQAERGSRAEAQSAAQRAARERQQEAYLKSKSAEQGPGNGKIKVQHDPPLNAQGGFTAKASGETLGLKGDIKPDPPSVIVPMQASRQKLQQEYSKQQKQAGKVVEGDKGQVLVQKEGVGDQSTSQGPVNQVAELSMHKEGEKSLEKRVPGAGGVTAGAEKGGNAASDAMKAKSEEDVRHGRNSEQSIGKETRLPPGGIEVKGSELSFKSEEDSEVPDSRQGVQQGDPALSGPSIKPVRTATKSRNNPTASSWQWHDVGQGEVKEDSLNRKKNASETAAPRNTQNTQRKEEDFKEEDDLEQLPGQKPGRFNNVVQNKSPGNVKEKRRIIPVTEAKEEHNQAPLRDMTSATAPKTELAPFKKMIQVLRHAPFTSVCFLGSIVGIAEGTRQIASLALIMAKSGSIVKRGEIPADINKFHGFMLKQLQNPASGSSNVMLLIHMWLFCGIGLLLLLYITALQLAEAAQQPNKIDQEQAKAATPTWVNAWTNTMHSIKLCIGAVIMSEGLPGPLYFWRQRSIRGAVTLGVVLLLGCLTALIGYLAISIATTSSNKTATPSIAPSSAIGMLQDKYLQQIAVNINPTAGFGLVHLFLMAAIPVTAYGIYTLFNPDQTNANLSTSQGIKWKAVFRIAPWWLRDIIVILLLLSPYLSLVLGLGRLLTQARMQISNMSGSTVFLLLNGVILVFTLPLIMAVLRTMDLVQRIRERRQHRNLPVSL